MGACFYILQLIVSSGQLWHMPLAKVLRIWGCAISPKKLKKIPLGTDYKGFRARFLIGEMAFYTALSQSVAIPYLPLIV